MTTTYNITHNAKFDSYEVTFESKPATAVLDALKALKMRWNPKKACWYGFAKESEILSAILENGEGETITGEKTEGATVYTDGYLGGGAVYGPKSNLHLYGADLSKAIREDLARRAHEMMSYTDYREGSATAEYNALCDRARTLAEEQRKKVDPMYHDKIDALLASYVRRMADNINRRNEIGTRCPSVLVAGPANFPVKKKLKQNAASDKNMEEYNEIQGILNKIRSVGTGGISGDDPNAREKIEKKIESLEALQNTMKAVNAYYRKHKTLDGCPDITPEQAHKIAADMERDWRSDPRPFEAYHLQNNNAEIHRLRERLAEMDAMSANPETGWTFDGGTVEICREDNRVRIFHDCKPDASTIAELKSHGFKWSPKAAAWQRQLTQNAIEATRRITT